MKNIRTAALCACILLSSLSLFAQTGNTLPVNEPDYNRSNLFNDQPGTIAVSQEVFQPLFDVQLGRAVSIRLSDATTFHFEGDVVSSVSKYGNTLQSVVIRSSNYPGARLTVSRITGTDGAVTFTGRILSMQHGDLYELKQTNNQLFLVKKKFHDLVNE